MLREIRSYVSILPIKKKKKKHLISRRGKERTPLPLYPRTWFLLNRNSSLSNVISATTAACSALEVMLYVSNDLAMFNAASWELAHSGVPPLGTGALTQDCDLGAMVAI